MNFQHPTLSPGMASTRVRILWRSFEQSQAKDRAQLDVTIRVALEKAEAEWKKAPPHDCISRIQHSVTKTSIVKTIKTCYFKKARAMWQEKLESVGLRADYWTDLTESEKRRIINILGADDEDVWFSLPLTSVDSTHPDTPISIPLKPPLPSLNIEDTHEPLPPATPFEPSARMFERARDVTISGGQFYNTAGSMNIDASHNKHTSTNSVALTTSVTNLWHASNQIVFPANMGEKLDNQKEGSKSDDHFRRTRSCLCEETMMHDGEEERRQNDTMPCSPLENEYPCSVVDHLPGCDKSDPENQVIDQTIADEVIHDILSNYPPPPIGNPRSFQRILQALISSFSPLSPIMTAALLNLDNAQQVKRILSPARPLIFIQDSQEEND